MLMPGTLLMEKDALHPDCFQLEGDTDPDGWMSVRQNLSPRDLEKELAAKGWTFFLMAGAVRMAAFGFDREKMIRAALSRVIKEVKQQRCNCLEIDKVAAHSFLGIPYVSVTAHPRQIQRGMVFAGR